MSQLWVVDASALLATIQAEPGSDFVEERIADCLDGYHQCSLKESLNGSITSGSLLSQVMPKYVAARVAPT